MSENAKTAGQSVAVFKCLGDNTRFAIVSILAQSDSYVELLAEKLSLTPGTVCHHLKKLEDAGLVRCSRSQYYQIYSLNRELMERTLSSFLAPESVPDDDSAYRQKVLDSFISGGRLKNIPAQLKKREIVFAYILRDLEPGRDYGEKEINDTILAYHDDYCYIRREMIALGLMSRHHETYRVIK